MQRIQIRNWRVQAAEPHGVHVWFDPREERVRLYRLPPSVGDVAAALFDDRVDNGREIRYLDSVVSVSALEAEAEVTRRRQLGFSFNSESENDHSS